MLGIFFCEGDGTHCDSQRAVGSRWEAGGGWEQHPPTGSSPPAPREHSLGLRTHQPCTWEPFQTALYTLQGTTSSPGSSFPHGDTHGHTLCSTRAALGRGFKPRGHTDSPFQGKRTFLRAEGGGGRFERRPSDKPVVCGYEKACRVILDAAFLSFKCHRLHYLASWLLETGKLHFNCFLIQLNLVQKLVCTL